jgi:hypothetical protein
MKYAVLILTAFIISIIPAQSKKAKSTGDEFWLESGYQYRLSKSFSIDYTLEQRFELNNDEEKTIYNEIKPSYKLFKGLTIDGGLRLRTKVYNTSLEYLSSLTYKYSIKKFDLSARLRYHKKIENDNTTKDYLRTKFSLAYEITKKIAVQAQTEFFYRCLYDYGDRFDKSRSGLDLDWAFAKNWELSGFWLYEHEFNTNKPNDTRIYGLSISLKFI